MAHTTRHKKVQDITKSLTPAQRKAAIKLLKERKKARILKKMKKYKKSGKGRGYA